MSRYFAALSFIVMSLSASATVVNGDFSDGLNSWSTTPGVTNVSNTAALDDTGAVDVWLYQGTGIAPGAHILEFDVFLDLSSTLPQDPFAFLDTFAASLYLFDDANAGSQFGSFGDFLNTGLWPGPSPIGGIALLSADSTGVFENAGNLNPIQGQAGWWHFDYTFSSPAVFAAPVFELFDLNSLTNDSEVRIDNVHLSDVSVIPEPGTLLLVAMGISGLLVRKRTARHYHPLNR